MARTPELNDRISEQNKKKGKTQPDDEPNEMELYSEWERSLALNHRKSVFDTGSGNETPGINTELSAFEKSAVFHTGKDGGLR